MHIVPHPLRDAFFCRELPGFEGFNPFRFPQYHYGACALTHPLDQMIRLQLDREHAARVHLPTSQERNTRRLFDLIRADARQKRIESQGKSPQVFGRFATREERLNGILQALLL